MEKINKKKIAILVNTYFQIIIAIKLKTSKYKDDEVDIIISNHSTDSVKIFNKLTNLSIFRKVYYINSKDVEKKRNRVLDNIHFLLFPNIVLSKLDMNLNYYDEYIFYNIDKYTYLIYDALKVKNKNLKVIRFEEGYISYLHINLGVSNSYRILRKILNKKSFEKSIDINLLFNPDLLLYNIDSEVEKIESFDRKDKYCLELINKIFDYNCLEDKYNQKYIFFEESFFCDGKDIDDLTLILKIADIVGKENILVKLHPRNKVDRFSKYGIVTNKTIGIPWEVIQMNNNFSDKVFLTISSGSVLASRLYFGDTIKTFLLYNCTNNMSDMVTEKYLKYLKKVEEKFGLDNFVIPHNEEEFLKILGEINGPKKGEKCD